MTSRKTLIAGNWKMNHGISDTIKFFTELTHQKLDIYNVDVLVCPSFVSLYTASITLDEDDTILLGAQNCHEEDSGAYTGEVTTQVLDEIGCKYVILGHSERRHIFGEKNDQIAKKVKKVIKNAMLPILCVGETWEDRQAQKTFDVIKKDLSESLSLITKDEISDVTIAYEPVWAIGTGQTATPQIAEEVHDYIRKWLAKEYGTAIADEIRILYGGSVKPENARELIQQENIDGALVGGASLNAKDFADIVKNSIQT